MELLAPAGSIESLKAAVAAGADAVYLGLGVLNARAKSTDFSLDNLTEWVRYCHLYGVKVYVTVNVELFEDEIPLMRDLVDGIVNAGCDAVIASDMATIDYCLRKGIAVHVSTQAGVHTVEGAKFFAEMGVKRVVLSREYALSQAKAIADLGIEVEVFVHGALCVSFSGGCLLSSYIGGQSGNRGRCKQPCRQLYTAYDEEGKPLDSGYLISPKDLAYDRDLAALQEAGVTSLKIEGRLKRPEYVSEVTEYYRALLNGEKPTRDRLLTIYNRGGFGRGYWDGKPIIYKHDPTHIGVGIGKVVKTIERGGYAYAYIRSDREIVKGDGLKIMRGDLAVGGSDVTSVTFDKGLYMVPVSRGVKVGDEVRLTTSAVQLKEAGDRVRKIPVGMKLRLAEGEPANLTVDGLSVSGATAGQGREMTQEELRSQLAKTGNTPFVASKIEVDYQGGYLPKSALNALRNEALDRLKRVLESRPPLRYESKEIVMPAKADIRYQSVVEVDDIRQVSADAVVFNPVQLNVETLEKMRNAYDMPAFVKIPRVYPDRYDDVIEWAKEHGLGLVADNVATVWTARRYGLRYIAGIGLNITNTYAADVFADAVMVVASPEAKQLPKGAVRYGGAIPLMTWAHCPWQTVTGKTCKDCTHKGKSLSMESKGKSFWIKPTVGRGCTYTMYAPTILREGNYNNLVSIPSAGESRPFDEVE